MLPWPKVFHVLLSILTNVVFWPTAEQVTEMRGGGGEGEGGGGGGGGGGAEPV